jgi:hypothetical protein
MTPSGCLDQDASMLRIAIAVFILLAACARAELTLDASSKAAMERSLAAMVEGMDAAQKEKLGDAVVARLLAAAFRERDADAARRTLHGLTAAQLLAGESAAAPQSPADQSPAAVASAAQREAQQRAERAAKLAADIEALVAKQTAAAQAKEQLAQFRVLASTFAFEESDFDRSPTIELHVRNDTAHPIARVYFDAVLATPGRSVPWVDTRFNYEIPGGLEPGEQATWRLAPNRFDDWGRAPADRDDMVLAVVPYRVDGADGKALYDARQFDADDDKRLRKLRAEQQALAALPAAAPR